MFLRLVLRTMSVIAACTLLVAVASAAEIEVIDLTGIDTGYIDLRVQVDDKHSLLVLTGKLNSRTVTGERIVGNVILKITLEDANGNRLDSRQITVSAGNLDEALSKKIGNTLPGLSRVRVESQKVTQADIDRSRRKAREAAIRATGWSKEIKARVIRGEAWIGMTREQARLSLGEPSNVIETITSAGRRELWSYNNLYLYFDNGVATMIQQSR